MSGLSPTQRTIRSLKEQGFECQIVEKWNSFAATHGKRIDLFGIIDIIALDPVNGVLGIQSCGQAFSEHYKKLTIEKANESLNWLRTPGTKLQLWGWRKVKLHRGGKAERWAARIREITVKDIEG